MFLSRFTPSFEPDLMSPSEHSPLLSGDWRRRQSPSFYQKLFALLRAEGEPSWLDSYKWFIFGSWANLLLLLVPVAAASHFLDWDAPLRFGFSFIAIIPLAKVCTTTLICDPFRDLNGYSLSCSAMPQIRRPFLLVRLLLACCSPLLATRLKSSWVSSRCSKAKFGSCRLPYVPNTKRSPHTHGYVLQMLGSILS